MANMSIVSSTFSEGQPIPAKYTCKGLNSSPPLAWFNLPASAKYLALICEDPDAPSGVFVHWVLYNIPTALTELPEGVPQTQQVPGMGTHGVNDFQHAAYDGPCPPPGNPHRYIFTLFALDLDSPLPQGWRSNQLQSRIKSHTLASAQITGTFQRV
jgi:Raf kinase inhibitor-like YbhB/YbcL family protein